MVISLLYLARQIRLSTKAIVSGTYQTHMDAWHALSTLIIENSEVVELLWKSDDERQELSPTDQIRFRWLANKMFANWEHWYADYQAGMITNADAESCTCYFRDLANRPGLRKFWESSRQWFYPEFVAFVDRELAAAGAPTGEAMEQR
ncbi:MAG: hypothetical protein RQ847_03170 [Wenzhouxiangellaceae bacterium]|nr:hypothetical protein [Wenzhouxiangellaceae bacterium]